MGLFKKTPEEKAKLLERAEEQQRAKAENLQRIQGKEETKAREKASISGFAVDEALYVFRCLPNDDEKGTLNFPFGAIFPDRVVKFQKRWTGNVIEETPIKNITSVEVSKGLLPTVTVYASANSITFKVGVEASKIASIIRELTASSVGKFNQVDPVTQVEKLAELMDKGLLTREEFETKKKEILGL